MTRMQVEHLSRDDTSRFCSLLQELEYVQRLCEVGSAFQMEIFGSLEVKERPFEEQ